MVQFTVAKIEIKNVHELVFLCVYLTAINKPGIHFKQKLFLDLLDTGIYFHAVFLLEFKKLKLLQKVEITFLKTSGFILSCVLLISRFLPALLSLFFIWILFVMFSCSRFDESKRFKYLSLELNFETGILLFDKQLLKYEEKKSF